MSDILKQLRDPSVFSVSRKDTADYIEELEKRNASLESLIKELFRLLDITEQTDEGRLFRPNRIYSRRALDAEKLEKVLSDLKATVEGRW